MQFLSFLFMHLTFENNFDLFVVQLISYDKFSLIALKEKAWFKLD